MVTAGKVLPHCHAAQRGLPCSTVKLYRVPQPRPRTSTVSAVCCGARAGDVTTTCFLVKLTETKNVDVVQKDKTKQKILEIFFFFFKLIYFIRTTRFKIYKKTTTRCSAYIFINTRHLPIIETTKTEGGPSNSTE